MKLTDHFRRLKVARLAAHSGSALVPKALFLKVKIVPSTPDILWLTSEGFCMCIHGIGPSRHSCLHLSVLAEVVIPSCNKALLDVAGRARRRYQNCLEMREPSVSYPC